MTPLQRVRWLILEKLRKWGEELPEITAVNIDALWGAHENDARCDARSEVRCSGETTNLEARYTNRNYECREVAAKCPDGNWVGWTYWYGGGKHGDPESSMEWMDDAYNVTVTEEQRMVRTFAAIQATKGSDDAK